MTLLELSVEYRDHARALDFRIVQLRDAWEHTMDEGERCMLAERIRVLSTMLREARECYPGAELARTGQNPHAHGHVAGGQGPGRPVRTLL